MLTVDRESFGIPIGDDTKSTSEVLSAFRQKGVFVTGSAIRRLRKGQTSGEHIDRRLGATNTQQAVARKDHYYLKLASLGMDYRKRGYYGRFSPIHFLEGLAEALGEEVHTIRGCFRSMRVDWSLAQFTPDSEYVTPAFISMAEGYLADYTNSKTKSPRAIKQVSTEWDGQIGSIDDFYRAFNLYVRCPVTAGTLPAYEVEVGAEFYRKRVTFTGRSPIKPTEFDRLSLATIRGNANQELFIENIRSRSGVRFDSRALKAHINILLYGRPTVDSN